MPKMKSHSGTKKRFKVTGSGKVTARKAGKRHLNEHKSSRVTRRLTGSSWPLMTADVAADDVPPPQIRWAIPASNQPGIDPGRSKENHYGTREAFCECQEEAS